MNRFIRLFVILILPFLFSCTEKEPEPQVIPVESVSLSQTTASLTIGKTVQLSASVSPSSATNKEITWSSSQTSVASVSSTGLVTAVGEGSATITAMAGGKKAECVTTVTKPVIKVSGIKLDKTELTLFEGKEGSLTATVLPENATDKTVTWSSSDPLVATVVSGKVTALKTGSTTITASIGEFKVECKVDVWIEYDAVPIIDLKPVEIKPLIGQIEDGDIKAYDHVEHLRIAEATRIIDMMWEYGAGDHSAEAYRSLMGRLYTGVNWEVPIDYPKGYDFIEYIGDPAKVVGPSGYLNYPSEHGFSMWYILLSWVNHAHFIMRGEVDGKEFSDYMKNHPNDIFIFSESYDSPHSKYYYDLYRKDPKYEEDIALFETENFIQFQSISNIHAKHRDGGYDFDCMVNRLYNEEYKGDIDDHGEYASPVSAANSDKNHRPLSHLMIAVGTSKAGDVDQTDFKTESSKFPVGFSDLVLFAGRPVFRKSRPDKGLHGWSGHYTSSPSAPWAAAMSCLCFQMFAEVKDVDSLLEMIRSTCLTDYIRLDGQTQPLQLINPAGLYKKYLTPQNLPESISIGETVSLEKGYYKGVIFSIPGAEVKVNDEWVAFDNKNKDKILAQNPMNLEWRLNGDLLRKMGYNPGQKVEGQIITVDDKWGGLRLDVPLQLQIR